MMMPGSVVAFLGEHREVLFPDVMFADLFSDWSGPAERPGAGGRGGVGVARHTRGSEPGVTSAAKVYGGPAATRCPRLLWLRR